MAEWKVTRGQISLFKHPNADTLDIADVNGCPIVCKSGLYKNGDVVICIPEKSILPENLWAGFKEYLRGPNKDRVASIRIRQEPSCAILIPDREEFKDIPFGEDISEKLGIVKFEPPIPAQLRGKIKQVGTFSQPITHHDVENYTINKHEFVEGEEVIISEKIHGSQCYIRKNADGTKYISSKGMIKRQWVLEEDGVNSYWIGTRNAGIFDLLDKYYPNLNIEAYGELLPCQKNYDYGQKQPTVILFDIRIDGNHIRYDDIPDEIKTKFVPIVYRGKYDSSILQNLAEQKERVSGKQTHWAEGVVLRPYPDRMSSGKNPFRLMCKIISKYYKESEESFA